MSTLTELEKDFRPGYRLTKKKGMYHVQDPQGELVRTETGAPIALAGVAGREPGWHQVRRIRSTLIEKGVMSDTTPRRRKAKERHTPRKVNGVTAHTNPLVVARSILQSPSSSSKERMLAKEVLRLYDQNDKLRELARRLGGYVRELEEKLERR